MSEFDRLKKQKEEIIARQSVQTAWLIEFKLSVRGVPSYYGKTVEGLGITEEHLDALRFSRKEDAEAVIEDNGWTEANSVEHMWGGQHERGD